MMSNEIYLLREGTPLNHLILFNGSSKFPPQLLATIAFIVGPSAYANLIPPQFLTL